MSYSINFTNDLGFFLLNVENKKKKFWLYVNHCKLNPHTQWCNHFQEKNVMTHKTHPTTLSFESSIIDIFSSKKVYNTYNFPTTIYVYRIKINI